MLVLARRAHDSIIIDEGIEITVLDTQGGTVKIGISASNDVPIDRIAICATEMSM